MLTPPPARSYADLDALVAAINQHARDEGYAVVKERTKKRKTGKVYKLYLKCDHGGTYTDKTKPGQRIRDTATRLTGCPFSLT